MVSSNTRLSIEEVIDRFYGDSESFHDSLESELSELLDTGSATLELSDGEGKEYEVVVSLHFDIKEETNVIA